MSQINQQEALKRLDAIEKEAQLLRQIINAPVKITDRVKDYKDIQSILQVTDADDVVSIKGFDSEENKVVESLIKKMRIAKVYNEGWKPKRGESRHYPYFDISSGFAFYITLCGNSDADSASASRLCFKNSDLAKDAGKKFIDIEKDFIDLR